MTSSSAPGGPQVRAVFTNLLPEGHIRHRLVRSLGLSANNDFGLLARIAGDCHGALSVRRPGVRSAGPPARRPLNEDELRNAIAVLPVHPMPAEADGLSATLAGEFDKLPLSVEAVSILQKCAGMCILIEIPAKV